MKCFVCESEAEEMSPVMGVREIVCPQCGRYEITGTAAVLIQQRMAEIRYAALDQAES